jgi:hypothetical protein
VDASHVLGVWLRGWLRGWLALATAVVGAHRSRAIRRCPRHTRGSPKLHAHEDAHRHISEHYYKDAAAVARALAPDPPNLPDF